MTKDITSEMMKEFGFTSSVKYKTWCFMWDDDNFNRKDYYKLRDMLAIRVKELWGKKTTKEKG